MANSSQMTEMSLMSD